jgi:hypothetical protein
MGFNSGFKGLTLSHIESFKARLYSVDFQESCTLGGGGAKISKRTNISILVMRCVKYQLKADVFKHNITLRPLLYVE